MFTVNERTSARYSARLEDETGAAINGAALVSLTLTLYDVKTETVLNGRNAQDVLNKNGVTVAIDGSLVWTLDPLDNQIVGAGEVEQHRAVFVATWAGTKEVAWPVEIAVRNVPKVP